MMTVKEFEELAKELNGDFKEEAAREFMLAFKEILIKVEANTTETSSISDIEFRDIGIKHWNKVTGDTHVAGGPFKEIL